MVIQSLEDHHNIEVNISLNQEVWRMILGFLLNPNVMKALKIVCLFLAFAAFTSCQSEEVNPKQTDGDPQQEEPTTRD